MIGDPSQISYLYLSVMLDEDSTFAREALVILARDYERPKSTYSSATSATALLDKWIRREELRCYDERGQVVTDFNPILSRGDDSYKTATESIESGWLIDRASLVQLIDQYGMTIPEAVAFKPGPDSTLVANAFGYTVNGAARALHLQCGAQESKWQARIMAAVRKGDLRIRDSQDGAYFTSEKACAWIERIAIADLNAWLKQSGASYQVSDLPLDPQSRGELAAAEKSPWVDQAVAYAHEEGLKQWKSGARQITARGVADAVSQRLAKEHRYHGQRGPRDASTVRKEALKNWHFVPPDDGASGASDEPDPAH